MTKKIVIIGGGTGGYVAAIRAAQLNAQVTLIEKDTLGGTCLNRGCIPTKALLQSAELLADIRNAAAFGISTGEISLDFSEVNKRKEAIVKQLVGGVSSLMRKNKINVIKATATVLDPKTVKILGEDDKIEADSIIIATGSKPALIPINGIDQPGVITSDEVLTMEQLPESVVIVGGGVIGLEFAEIMSRMGSKVTIMEMMPQILPTEDTEIASALESMLTGEGIGILTSSSVTGISVVNQKDRVVSFTTKDGIAEERRAEKVLVAVGRSPYTDELGVAQLGLTTDKGRLVVNEKMETNIPGIYAVGDVVGGFMLAHVAMEEGKCAVENIMGAERKMDYRAVPRCVYTSPEVAAVGLTEAEAKEEYGDIKVGRFPFIANGRALIHHETRGMVKVIADASYGQLLGVHILGPQATELIAEATLGIQMEATFEDIASAIHAHPTLSETMMEAALSTGGKAIHL